MSIPGIQVVAQVNGQQSIDDIRNKTGPASSFDINAFLGAVVNLHVLDHYSSPGLGDPKAALDDIYAAGLAVKAMVDGPQTVARASFDSFKSKYPSSRLIIQDQSAVAGAIQAAGCK